MGKLKKQNELKQPRRVGRMTPVAGCFLKPDVNIRRVLAQVARVFTNNNWIIRRQNAQEVTAQHAAQESHESVGIVEVVETRDGKFHLSVSFAIDRESAVRFRPDLMAARIMQAVRNYQLPMRAPARVR